MAGYVPLGAIAFSAWAARAPTRSAAGLRSVMRSIASSIARLAEREILTVPDTERGPWRTCRKDHESALALPHRFAGAAGQAQQAAVTCRTARPGGPAAHSENPSGLASGGWSFLNASAASRVRIQS
jgi:hypothetical protein